MRLSRTARIAAAMLATAALGVSAASAVVGAPPPPATPRSALAAAGSERVDQIALDPDPRKLAWAVRTYRSSDGSSCVEAGRVARGRFGTIGPDGRFVAVAVQQGGTCGDLSRQPLLLAINHYPAATPADARTVVFGRASPAVGAIVVLRPGAARRVLPGANGGFLLALPGALVPARLPVRVTLAGGRRLTFDWR